VSLLRSFAGVRKYNGRRKQMTTERMEAYSLEEGDQILLNGGVYRIYDIDSAPEPDQIIFFIVDEEGTQYKIKCQDTEKLPVVIDILSAIG
jgi:preprotein translocase subunit YajC